jgi:hypothetical protein
MIRLLLSGLWVCLVALGSTYAVVSWPATTAGLEAHTPAPESGKAHAKSEKGHAKPDMSQAAPAKGHGTKSAGLPEGMEAIKTRIISVPVVADNAVQGYVMAQFAFIVDGKVMEHLAIKPDVFLVDEAFKAIFEGSGIDFRRFKKQDLRGLTKEIAGNVNKRLGVRLIDDVLVQELNYIARDQVRGGRRL